MFKALVGNKRNNNLMLFGNLVGNKNERSGLSEYIEQSYCSLLNKQS